MHTLISLIPQASGSINFLVVVGHYETRGSMDQPSLKNYAIEHCQNAACCRVCNFKGAEKDLNDTEMSVD